MSAYFLSSVTLPIADGVGTVGYTVFDADGEELQARSTAGVVRLFEGDTYGIYQVRVLVSGEVTAGNVLWDDADGNAVAKPFFIGFDNSGSVSVGEYDSEVDADWGGSTSDSYVTLAEAEDLVDRYVIDSVEWDAGTGQKKDAALRMATRQIDSFPFLGTRQQYTQSLKFPRYFSFPEVPDRTEEQVKSDIQAATAIQAAYLLRKGGRDAHAEAIASGIRQSSESVGPIRDQFTYTGGYPMPLCTDAVRLIGLYRGAKKIYRA